MKLWYSAVLCATVFACSSCSNLKTTKITDENKDKIFSEIAASKDLTADDKEVLTNYIMRQSLAAVFAGGKPSIPTGKSIGEMLDEQRKWVAEEAEKEQSEKKKEQELASEIAAKEASLRELVTVTLYRIGERDSSFMSGFQATVAYKAGDKDLRAFEGDLALSDVLGNSLGEIPVKMLKPVKASESGTMVYSNMYMAFPDLRGKQLADIKAQWKPTKIILSDATVMSVTIKAD
jgi:hypothetical protein